MTHSPLISTSLNGASSQAAITRQLTEAVDDRSKRAESIGLWAGSLSLTELGIGSLLHALHVPLTGTILSLNQGLFLARITRLNRNRADARRLAIEVSSVTALIKSFAPIGKRLTPMLAIAAQGLLFTFGVSIFGVNILGVIFGSILLALWGIAQPLILAGVMFSTLSEDARSRILAAWSKLLGEIDVFGNFSVVYGIIVLITIKCVLAGALAVIAWWADSDSSRNLWGRLELIINRRINSSPSLNAINPVERVPLAAQMKLAANDLRNPLTLISLATILAPAYFLDSDFTPTIWMSMRAIAGLYAFYLGLRLLPWDRLLNPHNERTTALRAAMSVLRGDARVNSLRPTGNLSSKEN